MCQAVQSRLTRRHMRYISNLNSRRQLPITRFDRQYLLRVKDNRVALTFTDKFDWTVVLVGNHILKRYEKLVDEQRVGDQD